jgi:hypothetical protein
VSPERKRKGGNGWSGNNRGGWNVERWLMVVLMLSLSISSQSKWMMILRWQSSVRPWLIA